MKYGQLFSKEWYGTTLSSLTPEGGAELPSSTLQAYSIGNFLDPLKCKEIISTFSGKLEKATTTCGQEDFRTSEVYDLVHDKENLDLCVEIENKICETMNICFSHSEGLQLESFKPGQYYKLHTDWFTPYSEEYEEHAKAWGQRTWTFQIFLSNVEKGGELHIPALDGKNKRIPIKAGAAVCWNNLKADGMPNEAAAYEHEPVVKGHKYILTKMFRMKSLID